MPLLPVGDFVPSVSEVRVPRRMDYEGGYIALSPLDPQKDAPELFACSLREKNQGLGDAM